MAWYLLAIEGNVQDTLFVLASELLLYHIATFRMNVSFLAFFLITIIGNNHSKDLWGWLCSYLETCRIQVGRWNIFSTITNLFLGSDCEIDISVCNTTEKRCSNGGQCIEALGEDFFCFCPQGLFHALKILLISLPSIFNVVIEVCFRILI